MTTLFTCTARSFDAEACEEVTRHFVVHAHDENDAETRLLRHLNEHHDGRRVVHFVTVNAATAVN